MTGKELQVFKQQEVLGKMFTIYGNAENPLFLAKEVAEWIDYDKSSVSKMVNVVDDDEKVRNTVPTLGGSQEQWCLTEDGLYEVLMQSRKPIAKQFKKQVKLILKTIRKTGHFETPEYKIMLELQKQQTLLIEQHIDDQQKIMSLQGSVDEIKSNLIFQNYEPPKAKLISLETRYFCAIGQDRHTRKFYDAIMDYTGIDIPRSDALPKGVFVYEYIFNNVPMEYIEEFVMGVERGSVVKSKAGHWVNLNGYTVQSQWDKILKSWGHTCAYCGKSHYDETLVAEHVIPQSQMGVFDPKNVNAVFNVVPSCPQCNYSKYTHPMEKWFRHQPFFSEAKLQKIQRHIKKYEL
jgi:prophage antirepressor-like protein